MKSFRKLNLMFVMAFALLLLTACGGAAPEPEPEPEPAATEEPAAAEESSDAEESTEAETDSSEATEGSGTVTMVSWGGAYQEAQTNAYLTPYEEETGVKIVQDGPTDYAKIIAMVEAGQVTWDVVDIENDFAVGQTEKYFEPLDYSIIPKDEILPGLADEYRVGSILYATVLGYNTDVFSEAPQGWADFFDMEKFPGTRSLPQTASRYIMEVALVADGVDPDDLYPLDIDRALGVLDKIKDDVIFWETGSQSAQQLADEEAVMGMLWNGRIQTAIDEGAPLAIQWNQHVALPDYFAVPKGAPNKDEAMKLIAYMVSEEHNHKIADFISYAPVNVKTFDKINADMAPLLPTYEDRPSQGFQVSDAWWDDNRDMASERYNAWLLGEETASTDTGSSEEASGTGTVTMVSWGGAYQEAQTNAYLTPYEEETGVTVVQDGPTDYAKIIAMVEAGQVTWDVVDIENDFAVGKTEQYFEPLDYSIIPKDQILPGLADEYRVGSILYATVLGYNTDVFSEAPQGWADFFDMEKFPGTRSLPQSASRYVLEVALVADGVDPDDLYPLDVNRALGVLDKIKDDVIFWETGSQSAQQLADEEAVMGMLWNGRIQTAIDEGAPLAIQWNQHVALPDYFAVPKGAPNKVEAMKLIAYMVSEEHNHKIADFISYAPINVKTFDKVNPDMAPLLPTYEDRPSQGFQVSDAWWDENRDVVSEAYNAWLLGEEVSAVETTDLEGTGTVTMVSWGGAYQEAQTNAYLTPYEEETGVKVVQDGPTDYAKIIAMVEAGQVAWDVVDIENDFAVGQTEQYFEPIDYSIVPKDEILPGLADEYRVGSILYATVLGYNTDEFSEAPEGWADFFDMEKFPGTRSLPQTASRYVMEVALVADGVDPDDLYPLDIKRALGVLDKIKDDVIFWETGSQSAQQLADEEAVMGMLWNGRIQTAIDEGAPLAIQWNQHVALPDYFAVPKGAKNKVEAMKLIAYMVSEEHNHKISDFISYAPVNVKTFDKINPDMAPLLPTYEDRPSLGFQVSDAWWDENRDVVSEAYNAWLLGEEVSAVETTDLEGTGTVTMVSWGGAYQEAQTNAYLTPYEEETGVKVVQDGPTDYAKIIAMVEAGQVAWDVVDIENDFAVGQTEQYFEPIDYSIVPKDEILPGLADEYRVGSILYATVLGYNTDEFSEAPQGWADFFDMEKFPGTRSLPQTASRYIMEVALVADGVDPADLYPLDIDRALGVLDKIKDDVIFWETGSQSAQQLADEEAVMGMLWNGRIQTAIDEGAPLAIQWNQHVALPDYFAVPKGAKNKVEAMKLIAYMVSEEHNHKISDFISYAPVNVKTFDKINPDMAPLLPTYEDRPSLGFQVSDAWWDENRDMASERYNAWLLGE